MIGILLAVPELPQEQQLVAGASDRVLRRCVDGVDLLAAGATEPSAAVVVSAGLPRLSADLVERLSGPSAGAPPRVIIGLVGGEPDAERLASVGISRVIRAGPAADATLRVLGEALTGASGQVPGTGVWPTGCWEPAAEDFPVEIVAELAVGRIIAVWGAMGSPGRTTVATGVAEALAESGRRVCLVDADTYAPSVTMSLGIVEETSGLLIACRHADNGSLTDSILRACARQVRGSWHILGGLPTTVQWPDLRPAALERVWETCRTAYDVTVVDIGFCLEDDDAPGAWARRRNGAALTALAAADHVLAVADSGVVGAARVAGAWPDLRARTGGVGVTLVRNRARGSDRAWREVLAGCGVTAPVHPLPADPRALAACWRDGRSLGEGARRSRIRAAMKGLARVAVSG
ncbi:MAG: P-loop NTPase [Actinobacteria bacterium]|nr:P-loop NTPase [Actinomycetota bacterium]